MEKLVLNLIFDEEYDSNMNEILQKNPEQNTNNNNENHVKFKVKSENKILKLFNEAMNVDN